MSISHSYSCKFVDAITFWAFIRLGGERCKAVKLEWEADDLKIIISNSCIIHRATFTVGLEENVVRVRTYLAATAVRLSEVM